MPEAPDMLTLDQARKRFGKIRADGPKQPYLTFQDTEGLWRPVYDETPGSPSFKDCIGYRRHA